MTNMERFNRKRRNMKDEQLIALVDKEITKLAKTYGESHRMSVPPRIDDTDMLLSELLRRYKEQKNSPKDYFNQITTKYAEDQMTAKEIVELIGQLMDLVNVMKPTLYADLNNCSLTTVYKNDNLVILGGQRFVFDPE